MPRPVSAAARTRHPGAHCYGNRRPVPRRSLRSTRSGPARHSCTSSPGLPDRLPSSKRTTTDIPSAGNAPGAVRKQLRPQSLVTAVARPTATSSFDGRRPGRLHSERYRTHVLRKRPPSRGSSANSARDRSLAGWRRTICRASQTITTAALVVRPEAFADQPERLARVTGTPVASFSEGLRRGDRMGARVNQGLSSAVTPTVAGVFGGSAGIGSSTPKTRRRRPCWHCWWPRSCPRL